MPAVAKAYGGAKKIHWMEIYAGEKSTRCTARCLAARGIAGRAARVRRVDQGPLTTPVGGGIRSLNVALRQELDCTSACARCSTSRACPRR